MKTIAVNQNGKKIEIKIKNKRPDGSEVNIAYSCATANVNNVTQAVANLEQAVSMVLGVQPQQQAIKVETPTVEAIKSAPVPVVDPSPEHLKTAAGGFQIEAPVPLNSLKQ